MRTRWTRVVGYSGFILALMIAGCGGGGGGGDDGTSTPTSPSTPSTPPPPTTTPPASGAFGLNARPSAAALNFPSSPGAPPGSVDLQSVATGFSAPVFFTAIPNSGGRSVVVEQRGRILVLKPDFSVEGTLLDISSQVLFGGEQGLLGIAFDPNIASNGYFYIYYISQKTAGRCAANINDDDRCSRISRFKLNGNGSGGYAYSTVAPAGEFVMLEVSQPYDTHKSGMMVFGPDNKLYIGLGDGGNAGDPQNNAQNLNTLLGKIIRIDPSAATPYGIPPDNPFVGVAGARPEIWAYGFRNPWRFSFDRQGTTLWAGDVGQEEWEEIDIVTRGGNYGWNYKEGKHSFNGAGDPPSIDPIWEYNHNVGNAVTGGYVYRGGAVPGLQGQYIYGDYMVGTIWALDPATATNRTIFTNNRGQLISSFGEDGAGELYVVDYNGSLLRMISPNGAGQGAPQLLSQTGLFTSLAPLQAASGLIEYDVNTPLWSDGAAKRRWIALPDNTQITFSATDSWQLPVGSVVVKHFAMPMDQSNPTVLRNLETRVLVHQTSGWAGYTYRWNAQQTDATLLSTAESEMLSMKDANGTPFTRQYDYPSSSQCHSCHTNVAGMLLGVRTRQLNRNFNYVDANGQTIVDNQLRALNHIGMFNTDIGASTQYASSATLTDSGVPVAQRARDYLDANCSQCHQPGGPASVNIDLRSSVDVSAMNVVNAAPTAGNLGISGALIVAPGRKELSVLWQRMRQADPAAGRMPPLSSHAVDQAAVDVVGQWIDSLPQ